MAKAYSPMDARIMRYTDWLIRWRWPILLAGLIITAAFASGLKHFSLSTDYRVFFSADNPQLLAFDEVEQTYNKNDNILFVFAPAKGDVLSPRMLEYQARFTDEAWQLPYSRRVDSLTNFQRSQANGDELIVDDLVPNPDNISAEEIEEIRQYALSEPILFRRLIRADTSHVGLNVTFEVPGESPREVPEIVAAARELVARYTEEYPDVSIHMTGGVMINNAFSEAAQADIKSYIPAMYLVILLTVLIMTRSFSGMIATLLVISSSTLIAMGTASYLGVKFTPPSMTSPILIMTLAIADCVHVMLTMLVSMRAGMSKNDAMKESLRLNFMPVLITSVTTALGFLSINFSDSPPLQDLGNIVAMGVMMAFVLSVTWFPALLAILPIKGNPSENKMGQAMERFAEMVIARRKGLLIGMGVVTLGLTALVPLNRGNDAFVQYFDETIQFRTDTDYILDNLTGMYGFIFSLDSGEENGIADPEFLKKVEHFTQWFESRDETIHVNSVVDVFKRLNQNMHGGDPAYYQIPESRELAAQYLLLYEFSLPYGLDLTNQVSMDKSATRLVITIDDLDSNETRQLVDDSMQWLRDNYPELETFPVSPNIMFSYISERNIKSMVGGMIAALIGISFLMIFALRNIKIGLLSLIPNLIPMGMAFGIWGLFVGEINFTMAVVMGMTLGIVVDDTVHYLSKYLRARREQQLTTEDSVRYAFRTVGGALFTMSIVLIAGFLVLANSHFLANSGMSKLTVIAIACALIADFLLLPPLLMLADRRFSEKRQENAVVTGAEVEAA